MKHTGCGMLTFKNEDAYGVVEKNLGYVSLLLSRSNSNVDNYAKCRSEAASELKSRNLDFLPFPELDAAVEEDVRFLKSSKLVPNSVTISGWVYEVETGKTRKVC